MPKTAEREEQINRSSCYAICPSTPTSLPSLSYDPAQETTFAIQHGFQLGHMRYLTQHDYEVHDVGSFLTRS